jgi:hypothetical protein
MERWNNGIMGTVKASVYIEPNQDTPEKRPFITKSRKDETTKKTMKVFVFLRFILYG